MTEFCIETYINNLPENTEIINVTSKQIKYLPDLTRFKNLKILYCSNNQLTLLPSLNINLQILHCYNNQLTFLPTLNENLQELHCYNNQLTKLPPLNTNLQTLNCHNNKLTFLPPLNEKLETLYCNNNQLTFLPPLNTNLQKLHCYNNQLTMLPILNSTLRELYYVNNPIYEIIDSHNLFINNKKIQILHKFCYLYYCLKFKTQFRDFLWKKIREPQIIKKYHPSYLNKLLIDDAEGTEDLDMVLNSWL